MDINHCSNPFFVCILDFFENNNCFLIYLFFHFKVKYFVSTPFGRRRFEYPLESLSTPGFGQFIYSFRLILSSSVRVDRIHPWAGISGTPDRMFYMIWVWEYSATKGLFLYPSICSDESPCLHWISSIELGCHHHVSR